MDGRDPLIDLVLHLLVLSLVAVGGINVILPDLHRVAVLGEGWMTDEEFTTLFALAQAAPGPNMLFVTLIGWKVGGIPGGLAATAAMSGPAVILAYGMARLWLAWGHQPWFTALRNGLAPLTVGLIVASAALLTIAAASGWQSYAVTAVAAAIVIMTRVHPIIVLACAGALGVAGLV